VKTLSVALAAAALIAGACRDTDVVGLPTVTRLTVTLAAVHGPTVIGAPPTATTQCTVDLRARFESPDDQILVAQWIGATRLTYVGGSRVDSVNIGGPTVSEAWGGSMTKGAAASSTWTVSASAPFRAAFVFVYLVEGKGAGSSRVEFACGEP